MNERIEELISAYLHRGSTPEQERELFEACSRHPETAELLRQHLVLSLKIRTLREDVQVPTEVRNEVLRRVNTLETEGLRREELPQPHEASAAPRRRFGWAHLLGTGFAAASCTVAILLWTGNSEESSTALQSVAQLQDTVYIVKKDTVTQLREIDRPVYIVRSDTRAPSDAGPRIDAQDDIARRQESPTSAQDEDAVPELGTQPGDAVPVMPVLIPSVTGGTVSIAEVRDPETMTREEKAQSYIEQYNSMLVSVESVRLSSKDRLH